MSSILAHFMNQYDKNMADNKNRLEVRSTVFAHNGHIPSEYTCEGRDINPPIEVSNIPEGTKTLALIVDDPDAPKGVFDHWLVWNISPNEAISEGNAPGINGINGFGKTGYGGPCPPSGTHRYFFKVYALDTALNLETGADKKALYDAMQGHILAEGELMGLYQKRKMMAGS
jgi:Raf kinase inhibitor-like YbhB/YbcL family protein